MKEDSDHIKSENHDLKSKKARIADLNLQIDTKLSENHQHKNDLDNKIRNLDTSTSRLGNSLISSLCPYGVHHIDANPNCTFQHVPRMYRFFKMCSFGTACPNAGSKSHSHGSCQYFHNFFNGPCYNGINCQQQDRCRYQHNPSYYQPIQLCPFGKSCLNPRDHLQGHPPKFRP